MKFKKVTARFDGPDMDAAEQLICDIFFSFSLKGVVCDIPLEEPDEGFGTHTLEQPEHPSITGYLPLLDATPVQIEKIEQQTRELAHLNIRVEIHTETVDEKDWADAWKDYFEVTRITDRITIKPEWKPYTPTPGEQIIHLDPGMAFGTGTHPTTAMCIQLMDQYLTPGGSFLDVGTGSGILMVAAARLGASSLIGIDTDPVAVSVAAQNLEKNDIPADQYDLTCTTLDRTTESPSSFIAANIIAQVIVDIMPDIAARMNSQTIAVLSGIIEERLPDVTAALEKSQLDILYTAQEDEWVALAVKRA